MPQVKRKTNEAKPDRDLVAQNDAIDPGLPPRRNKTSCPDDRRQSPPAWERLPFRSHENSKNEQNSAEARKKVRLPLRQSAGAKSSAPIQVSEQTSCRELPETRQGRVKGSDGIDLDSINVQAKRKQTVQINPTSKRDGLFQIAHTMIGHTI